MDHPIWKFVAKERGHWDDYASAVYVYPDRVEYTTGWENPQTYTVPGSEITYVKKGIFGQKGVVMLYTASEVTYEIMAAWHAEERVEFMGAVKSIMLD